MGKSLKDVSRKVEKKREHLESMPFETTPAQRLMRSEMEAGLHKQTPTVAIKGESRPMSVGAVLDDVVGQATSAEQPVTDLAYEIINRHGEGLKLGLREWQIIQNMVEAGIHEGYRRAAAEDFSPGDRFGN